MPSAQNNRIMRLPEEVGSLARLKTLDVSNNDLKDLPAALGYLPELHRLVLDGNPLRTIRRSLLSGEASSLKVGPADREMTSDDGCASPRGWTALARA